MKKKIISFVLAIVLILSLTGCSVTKKNNATIFVATDTHYLSSAINDKGNAFWRMMESSDGKVVEYSEEIFDAFASEVIASKPDVLILSGDLTFNGEKASHIDLANKLMDIQNAGVQVLTIAGNHDIDNIEKSIEYKGTEFLPAETVTAKEFKDIYFDLGMKQATSIDKYSLSYLYKVNNGLYILMLDTNAYGRNFVQDPSYEWIEAQLKLVQKENAQVITVSHQNLFAHNEKLSFGYQLYDADELLELYNKYKVACNLSGHIHLQHIIKDGITEITTSSLLVSPIQYGVVNFDGKIKYHTQRVDVENWARDNKSDNKDLLGFAKYSKEVFLKSGRTKSGDLVKNLPISNSEKEEVVDTFAKLNASYFAGEKLDKKEINKGLKILKGQDDFISKYMDTMLAEAKKDYTKCTIKPRK